MPEQTDGAALAAPAPEATPAPAPIPVAESHVHYLIREGVHSLKNELDRIGPMAKADYQKLVVEVHKLIDNVPGDNLTLAEAAKGEIEAAVAKVKAEGDAALVASKADVAAFEKKLADKEAELAKALTPASAPATAGAAAIPNEALASGVATTGVVAAAPAPAATSTAIA